MEQADFTSSLIPQQTKGTETGAEHTIELYSRLEAINLFRTAMKRLLDVNRWHIISGSGSALFKLYDKEATPVFREAMRGDFIRIDLPGPGPQAGQGFDWVIIEAMEDKRNAAGEEESFSIRTRPVKDPTAPNKDVAHFYTSDATSTFLIERKGEKLVAAEIGKNEVINTNVSTVKDVFRNAVLASGARAGFSSLQWKSLVQGLLKKEDE